MNFDEETQRVVVVNIRMPFWSMVVFMVKWTVASVPALLVLFFIAALLLGALGGILRSILYPFFG